MLVYRVKAGSVDHNFSKKSNLDKLRMQQPVPLGKRKTEKGYIPVGIEHHENSSYTEDNMYKMS